MIYAPATTDSIVAHPPSGPEFFNSLGYEPTWAGQVETQPSLVELHALITPT